MFRFDEKPSSVRKTSNPPTEERTYFASGTLDASYVEAYAYAATPSLVVTAQGILYRQDIKINEDYAGFYTVTVPYAADSLSGSNVRLGEYRVNFDTTGGTIHVRASKQSIARFPDTEPANKQLINWTGTEVEGTEVVSPALKLSVTFRHPAGIVSMSRVRQLARNTAYVCSDKFLGFDAGEVLFLGATGSWGTDAETEVQYHFACSQNAQGLSIGDIANIVKDGHDYAWIKWKDAVVDGKPLKVPGVVYIERIYSRTSLSALLGFGA